MSINHTIAARVAEELKSRGWEKHTATCVDHGSRRTNKTKRTLWSIVMELRAGLINTEADLIETAAGMDY